MLNSAKKTFFVALTTLSVVTGSSSTWIPGGTGDLANPNPPPAGDWSAGLPNVSPSDVGLFTANGAPNPSLDSTLTLSNMTFDPTSPTYTFTLTSPANLTVTGAITLESPNFAGFLLTNSTMTFSGNSDVNNGGPTINLTGSELNLTGPAGTRINASVISDATSTVVIDQNTLVGDVTGNGQVHLVNSTSELIYTSGPPQYSGVISGNGSLEIGSANLTLTNANTFSGGTTILQTGQLIFTGGGALNPQGSVEVNGLLNLNSAMSPFTIGDLSGDGVVFHLAQNFVVGTANNSTFGGRIFGFGTLTKQGTGTLELTGNISTENITNIVQGTLNLATGTTLISDVNVMSGGTLAGTGTVLGPLEVMSGSTILPGSPGTPGTFNVDGSYGEASGSNYIVQINGGVNSSIAVTGAPGTAVLAGGEVVVMPDASVLFNTPYTILSATGGVTGTFDGVVSTTPLLNPVLIYPSTGMTVLLELFPTFENGARTYNQRQVANQLNTITSPDAEQTALFAALFSLDPAEVGHAYDLLSGNQYTSDPFAFSLLSREFVRRLYDPLRPIITSLPCERCYDPCGVDVWVEGGWDRAFLKNDGNGFGFNLTGWEITAGLQKTFGDWTFGIAGSYEQDDIRYNLSGHGKMRSGFAGIYGLYRPDNFYILADLTYGYNENDLNRPVAFGTFDLGAFSRPNIQDVTVYVEGGLDLPLCYFLVQPFVGIESNSFWRDSVHERGLSDFDLILNKTDKTIALSRLGVHVTMAEVWGISLSVDAAWDYQFTRPRNDFRAHFATFGNEFTIQGAKIARNSFEGEVSLTKSLTDTLLGYVEFSGQVWSQASSYSLVAGLQKTW